MTDSKIHIDDEVLKHYWGFSSSQLRPGQRDLIEQQDDSIGIMPTGGGKSLSYLYHGAHAAYHKTDDITIVISPLIALMDDQASLPFVEAYHSGLDDIAAMTVQNNVMNLKTTTVMLMSPERLANLPPWMQMIKHRIKLIAIDEAHCISEWGRDFRPQYHRLGDLLKKMFPETRLLALTATASEETLNEIIKRLHLGEPEVIMGGASKLRGSYVTPKSRRNIEIKRIIRDNLIGYIASIMQNNPRRAIAYVTRRKDCKSLATVLKRQYDITAYPYHAGMTSEERTQMATKWMENGGLMIGTSAFGMGVDSPDVRHIFMCGIQKSLDLVVQMIGRGSRDGERARAHLITGQGELDMFLERMRNMTPSPQFCKQIHDYVKSRIIKGTQQVPAFTVADLWRDFPEDHTMMLSESLKCLSQAEAVRCTGSVYSPRCVQLENPYTGDNENLKILYRFFRDHEGRRGYYFGGVHDISVALMVPAQKIQQWLYGLQSAQCIVYRKPGFTAELTVLDYDEEKIRVAIAASSARRESAVALYQSADPWNVVEEHFKINTERFKIISK